jgi:hypothetical protein
METDSHDSSKKAPRLAQVVPDKSEREDLALVEAQANASVASITAIGEQMKALAESPGVKMLLEGMGQSLAKRWDYETVKLEKEHEQKMQADRLAAQTQARRDLLGMILVGGGLLAMTALALTIVALVAKGIITQGQAAIVAGIIASLATGLGFGRKMRGDSK